MELFVANFSLDVQEEELLQIFQEYGTVEYIEIVRDEASNASKGYGFVVMEDENEALQAAESLHKSKWLGRVLKVRQSFNASGEDDNGKYHKKNLKRKDKQRDLMLFDDVK